MKKIEEIKNEISRDLGNENFKELFKNAVRNMPIEKAFLKINDIINEASLIYANKCVKDSLKKASEKAEIIILSNDKKFMITGKTKEDFLTNMSILTEIKDKKDLEEYFSKISDLIKNAYYVDFFDSIGIYITSDYFELNKGFYSEILNENFAIVKPTRQEALTEAIKKANEIYNSKI